MMINVIKYDDLSLYKQDVLSFLEQHDAENNLILGILQSLTKKDEEPLMIAAVTKENHIVLALLRTHPRQIVLSKAEPLNSGEIQDLAERLHHSFVEIPGLIGEKELTSNIARHIEAIRGLQANVQMNQRIYRLKKVKKNASGKGRLRRVELKDIQTIQKWVHEFCAEINQPISLDEAEQKAKAIIEKGKLYAWEVDGVLVSMANATRPTKNNITISYVYTPFHQRNKGYASNCVSSLSQFMLDNGYKTISLYTDLSNPTSNKIYAQIGYEAMMDSIVIHF
jgi:predicted GNAT family acetyltransferase